MKRVFAGLVLGIVVSSASVCGYLYQTGYWDTWLDKEQQLASELEVQFNTLVGDSAMAKRVATCVAKPACFAAHEADCPISYGAFSTLGALKECLDRKSVEFSVGMKLGEALVSATSRCLQSQEELPPNP